MTHIRITHGGSSLHLDHDGPLTDVVAAALHAWDHTLPTSGPAPDHEQPLGFVIQQQPAQVELAEDR